MGSWGGFSEKEWGFPDQTPDESTMDQSSQSRTEPSLTILVVEPSATMRSVYASQCAGRGATVECVDDVAEAIAWVSRRKPAAIITVDELKGLNGSSLVAALKSSPEYRAIPIVLMTPEPLCPGDLGHYLPDHFLVKDNTMRASLEGFLDSIGLGLRGVEQEQTAAETLPEGTRILLAEDNAVNQTIVGRILHVAGAEVVAVGNGAEAVTCAMREPFDLVLMDIQMPTLDGYEATRILRSSGLTTPILALTGEDRGEFEAQSMRGSFDGVLYKPVERTDLLCACARQLRERQTGPRRDDEAA